MRLSELKQALVVEGVATEFMPGGALLVGGHTVIRRDPRGRITLEGSLSDEFYKVRQIIYDQYHQC